HFWAARDISRVYLAAHWRCDRGHEVGWFRRPLASGRIMENADSVQVNRNLGPVKRRVFRPESSEHFCVCRKNAVRNFLGTAGAATSWAQIFFGYPPDGFLDIAIEQRRLTWAVSDALS